ncbi:hypothetical protein BDB00DRAFT_860116 [Zychaea mexicana]|uniref:uncharacterized protein n=1 Tax=Zychaea mexicana TaxID=64656 RepID=UPI0022FE6C33|nr:uncharacterized protein BDB00DRAFT_860116 [Zychaea mexicana]KAI9474854.1 hypothetical protein BDB00DRAFT_860116 [Zychaea mexicana]
MTMMHDGKQFVFVERKKTLQLAESCGLGVIEEETYLVGYQIYIIEQWLCDRSITSNTIKVFTGDQNHYIKVCVIRISTAELQHPRPEIQAFFNTHTPLKFKPTPLGEIMLTDPSELPFDMDMVLVPDGDYDKWINQAYVNINLRRTNCTGRSALNLRKPNPASEEKFRSIYKIAETVPFERAVINLVTVAQIALYLFDLLRKEYIDGLICNETTKAFWEFYTKYHPHKSPEYQLKEPWMEPHLLAALVSKLVLCRNKLHAYNFTTIKDPFADYEHFRFDIEEYQRTKNLRRTKMIDLETLEKLNEHTVGQLKVRNVIKSKLDDISGISNSPLFTESSDPEVFRHHATIESLRAIWRPRLKSLPTLNTGTGGGGGSSSSGAGGGGHGATSSGAGGDLEKQHEFIHMIKGVSARTTRTSGAAAEILSKFAGSLPWVDSSKTSAGSHVRSNSGNRFHSTRVVPPPPAPPPPPPPPPPARHRPTNHSILTDTSIQLTDPSGISTVEDILYPPGHAAQTKTSNIASDNALSSDDEFYNNSHRSDLDILPRRMIPERQDTPIEQRTELVASPISIRSDGMRSDVAVHNVSDFTPVTQPHRIPRRARSVSDSIVPANVFFLSSHHSNTGKVNNTDDDEDDDDDEIFDEMIPFHRTHSLTVIPTFATTTMSDDNNEDDIYSDSADESVQVPHNINNQQRPAVTMDIQTYLMFEKLQRQHATLHQAYEQLQRLAGVYEQRANQLRTTYMRRSAEFEQIERAARQAMDEQHETEIRLKDVEDGSAKLHYELNVLNENLKDVEENVSTFYNKVSLLEHKMHDSQQSITTMLIIGNYFDYYWRKIKGWVMGGGGSTTTNNNSNTSTTTTTPLQ